MYDDPARTDLRITVEADDGRPTPAPVAALGRVRGCRHRVRARDLTSAGQWLLVVAVATLQLGLLAHLVVAVIAGWVMADNGVGLAAMLLTQLVVGTALTVVGEVELVRIWLSPHRSEAFVLALQWVGTGVLALASAVIAAATGNPAAVLLAVPALLVSLLLSWLFTALDDKHACPFANERPPRIRPLVAGPPPRIH